MDRRHLPIRLRLTPGQASDKTTAPDLVEPHGLTGDLVVDRGRFGQAVIAAIEASCAKAHIPSQSNVHAVQTLDRGIDRDAKPD